MSVSRVKECAEVVIRDSDNEDDIADAKTVLQALRAEIPPAAKVGEIGKGRSTNRVSNTNSKASDSDSTYVISRLKRDQPELAKQVEDGELSPHRAAIQAGIRKPMMQVWRLMIDEAALDYSLERRWRALRLTNGDVDLDERIRKLPHNRERSEDPPLAGIAY